jgi:hypothetical protein
MENEEKPAAEAGQPAETTAPEASSASPSQPADSGVSREKSVELEPAAKPTSVEKEAESTSETVAEEQSKDASEDVVKNGEEADVPAAKNESQDVPTGSGDEVKEKKTELEEERVAEPTEEFTKKDQEPKQSAVPVPITEVKAEDVKVEAVESVESPNGEFLKKVY